jgi:plasmid stabilization system protein ParE
MSEVVMLQGADADLIELFNKYEDWLPGLGYRFDKDFCKACDLLAEHPEIAPKWRSGFRRLLLRHWHLGMFYEVAGSRVFIHAILDLRQDPEHIERRLGLR